MENWRKEEFVENEEQVVDESHLGIEGNGKSSV